MIQFDEEYAELVIENGIIDTVVDMTCSKGYANTWHIASIVPILDTKKYCK